MQFEQPHRVVGIACLNVDHAAVILAQQRGDAVAQNRMIIDNEYFHVNKNKVGSGSLLLLENPAFGKVLILWSYSTLFCHGLTSDLHQEMQGRHWAAAVFSAPGHTMSATKTATAGAWVRDASREFRGAMEPGC
ncbi:hypothetical protein [Burkholderia sp. BCC0044]|uniref:hypothetical protein n=1 Tax=Burkholderia sp. BCC0044 TaxID=2676295 RepID=UPI001FC8D7FB|nr:hypothetical protein [Burkholderia sp. BCC0044]